MSPSAIHEHTIKYLTNCIRQFMDPYESDRLQASHLPNSGIMGEEGSPDVIPDVRLDLEPRYGTFGVPITVWVGECGYSQSRGGILKKLQRIARNAPSIKAAFMVTIQNSGTSRHLPKRHSLLSEPPLTMSAFSGPLIRPLTALTEVKVRDIVWAAIQSVEIFVFIRGNNGEFDFQVRNENPLAARGLLHPKIEIEDAAQLLNTASRQLLIAVADIMEANDDEDHSDLRDAAETAVFPIDWNFFLEHIQGSLHQMAFFRYKKWRNQGQKDQSAGSAKRSNRRCR